MTHKNASLESQLLFLRKLNEFFKPVSIGKLKEDDLRAKHYSGFKCQSQSIGCSQFFLFLRDSYPSFSTAMREDVEFYIEKLEQLKELV